MYPISSYHFLHCESDAHIEVLTENRMLMRPNTMQKKLLLLLRSPFKKPLKPRSSRFKGPQMLNNTRRKSLPTQPSTKPKRLPKLARLSYKRMQTQISTLRQRLRRRTTFPRSGRLKQSWWLHRKRPRLC